MSGLKRGLFFSRLAFRAAFKLPTFIKATGFYFLGVLILMIVWFIPLALTWIFLGTGFWGMAVIGSLCALLFLSLVNWAEICSLPIARQFDAFQCGRKVEAGYGTSKKFKGWQDIMLYGIIYPAHVPVMCLGKMAKPKKAGLPAKADTGLWLKGNYLVKPMISVEGRKLRNAFDRVSDLVAKNLLRFNPELIRVKQTGNFIALVLLLIGVALGIFTGLSLLGNGIATISEKLLSVGVGLIISTFIASTGIGINSYLQTIYQTAIYRWMVNVDVSKGSRVSDPIEPPKILSEVLNKEFG